VVGVEKTEVTVEMTHFWLLDSRETMGKKGRQIGDANIENNNSKMKATSQENFGQRTNTPERWTIFTRLTAGRNKDYNMKDTNKGRGMGEVNCKKKTGEKIHNF